MEIRFEILFSLKNFEAPDEAKSGSQSYQVSVQNHVLKAKQTESMFPKHL
jgi:hypothetical protein